jgi:hypothetical protein
VKFTTPNAKSKASIFRIKVFVGAALIKSGAVMKKTFKDRNAFPASTPHEKS